MAKIDNFPSDQEIPPFDFKKPDQLVQLEEMSRSQREAMTQVEVQERIEYIAHAIALGFWKAKQFEFEKCVELVSSTLRVIGNDLGDKVGLQMVAKSHEEAIKACRLVYNIDPFGES